MSAPRGPRSAPEISAGPRPAGLAFGPSDRTIVAEWSRGRSALTVGGRGDWPVQIALHTLLARLRHQRDLPSLVGNYHASVVEDFAIIRAVIRVEPLADLVWDVRDAAFHRRWRELTGDAG